MFHMNRLPDSPNEREGQRLGHRNALSTTGRVGLVDRRLPGNSFHPVHRRGTRCRGRGCARWTIVASAPGAFFTGTDCWRSRFAGPLIAQRSQTPPCMWLDVERRSRRMHHKRRKHGDRLSRRQARTERNSRLWLDHIRRRRTRQRPVHHRRKPPEWCGGAPHHVLRRYNARTPPGEHGEPRYVFADLPATGDFTRGKLMQYLDASGQPHGPDLGPGAAGRERQPPDPNTRTT